ncbi:DnaD domain protein [Vagococcus sp. DIV0080]|uniref:DnaD domain protein n=1 Tax=Candidatus Vagococcus giribetii TaxID=2230876 RepID=A0ABS3HVC7_9ENTE|nr:DnaD domain protein [Vagococcus sp. DIV0080]MBO0477702.1 DnaD domain protein [Vagococcus sp. DIV0080]
MLSINEFLKADLTNVSNLLLKYYKKIGMSDKEFLFYLQLLSYNQMGNPFPDLSVIAETMDIPVDELFKLLQHLIDQGIISIETNTNQQGQKEDSYNLTLVYERLSMYLEQQQKKTQDRQQENQVVNLYRTFETEFGRPLSPIEFETIQSWLTTDHYDIELIQLALREAVLNQAYSLKYIDRILLSWERKNLTSKQQVQVDQKKRLAKIESQSEAEIEEELPHIPLYNWLNPNQK